MTTPQNWVERILRPTPFRAEPAEERRKLGSDAEAGRRPARWWMIAFAVVCEHGRMRVLALLAVACLPVAAVTASATGRAALPSPERLVLRPADLGGSFSVRSRQTGRPAAAEAPLGAARGPAEKLAHWGKTGGCRVDLVRRLGRTGLQDGPLEVVSSASVYRSEAGARRAFAYARRSLVPAAYAPLALAFRLGQQARQYVRQGPSALGTMLVYLVIWRERNVNASLVILGRVGVVSAFDVAPLARRQEARIRAEISPSPRSTQRREA